MKREKNSKTIKKTTISPNTKPNDGLLEAPVFPVPEKIKVYDHSSLLNALYWVYDFMDRALINFFVIGDTAKAVINNVDMYGDKVTVGVRRLEWESGARNIADSFATPVSDEGNVVRYTAPNGVPIILYVLEDDPCINTPNQKIYHSEFIKFPNPYTRFMELYPEIS